MRKSLIAGAATLAFAAGGALAGVTAASGAPDTTARAHVLHLNLVERATTDTVVDTGAPGDSRGDLLSFANDVYDAANKHRVGTDNGSCVRTDPGTAYECEWTLTLRHGGSLVVQGPFYDAADSVLAITGGTGRFAGASGQMVLHARNAAGTAYDFRYAVRD